MPAKQEEEDEEEEEGRSRKKQEETRERRLERRERERERERKRERERSGLFLLLASCQPPAILKTTMSLAATFLCYLDFIFSLREIYNVERDRFGFLTNMRKKVSKNADER